MFILFELKYTYNEYHKGIKTKFKFENHYYSQKHLKVTLKAIKR